MKDPNFPYPVKIWVKEAGRNRLVEREGKFSGNNLFIPLNQGEVYEIWVTNRSAETVVMRLLVDGLNTQAEMEMTKGLDVVALDKRQWIAGKRVNLSEANYWIFAPIEGSYPIRGFYSEIPKSGEKVAPCNEFKVVDARKSLAARQKYTDEIGMITAAFYRCVYRPVPKPEPPPVPTPEPPPVPKAGSRGMGGPGTDMGDKKFAAVKPEAGTEPGELLAVVHLRYVEPEALKKMR